MDCGRYFTVSEYLDDIDETTWERISLRPSNRA